MLLGLDIGTGGCKAILISPEGKVIASAVREYPLRVPRPLWSEQDPAHWWSGSVESIREILEKTGCSGKDIEAIGLTGQMHGLVALDQSGAVIRPCILWNDQRTGSQCREIETLVGGPAETIRLTGNPVLTGFTAPKILWMRREEPVAYGRIAKVLLPKDYIRYRLSGAYFSDVSDASGTSLLNVQRRSWSLEMLQALEIPLEWMPSLTESVEISSVIGREAAEVTGLLAGTPIVGGAGDQAAQAVGTGIVREGTVSVTIGTSGVVFAASDSYRADPEGRLHAFCHAVPGMWHLMGVMLSAGGSLRWYRDTFYRSETVEAREAGRSAYDLLAREAAEMPAGCEGLLFLPYLTGERTPYPDPYARGVFFGCTLRHTRAHFTRAVMEGIGFGLCDSLSLIRAAGISSPEIRISGGGARSRIWMEMLADIFNTPLATVGVEEGAAYGAALLAGAGAKVFRSVREAAERAVRISGVIPAGGNVEQYRKLQEEFSVLYRVLKREFRTMHDLTIRH